MSLDPLTLGIETRKDLSVWFLISKDNFSILHRATVEVGRVSSGLGNLSSLGWYSGARNR